MNRVIGITGFSSSGKGTLSKHFGNAFGMDVFSIGDYESKKFAKHGTPINYYNRLGVNTTYYALWDEYLNEVSKLNINKGIVVDGICTFRFAEIVAERIHNASLYILNVCAPTNDRIRFFSDKNKIHWLEAETQLFQLDRIKMNLGIVEVIRKADLMLNNNTTLTDFLRRGEDIIKSIM